MSVWWQRLLVALSLLNTHVVPLKNSGAIRKTKTRLRRTCGCGDGLRRLRVGGRLCDGSRSSVATKQTVFEIDDGRDTTLACVLL
jgi:hypothetical protein